MALHNFETYDNALGHCKVYYYYYNIILLLLLTITQFKYDFSFIPSHQKDAVLVQALVAKRLVTLFKYFSRGLAVNSFFLTFCMHKTLGVSLSPDAVNGG
jgi:hypothetical protein